MHLIDAGVGGIKGARDRIKADLAGNLLLQLAPQRPALNDFEWFARQENQLYSVRPAEAGHYRRCSVRLQADRRLSAFRRTGGPVRIQNRWFQLVAAVIAMVMIANLQYSWTLFVNPLQQGTG